MAVIVVIFWLTNKFDQLIEGKDSDQFDFKVELRCFYDCRIRIRSVVRWQITSLKFRLFQVVNSGAMTITSFDNNYKIRRANRANG